MCFVSSKCDVLYFYMMVYISKYDLNEFKCLFVFVNEIFQNEEISHFWYVCTRLCVNTVQYNNIR